ncbi:curli-like amyloid fiber formation chaperone CsgH [Rhodomicrobium vannielii]|uniref:curli-like amyloid fiber formation chaperone CsgH n=2 Tax=Rhodomicrobium TaxID=1068 RepID=UPI001AECC3BB|nr:curli-like amyloid fiber formation chaperone CsgH [Rhodomicrobium vannielii]
MAGQRFIPLALGLGVMVVASEHGAAASAESGPIRCEIKVLRDGGGVQLEGMVFASDKVAGSYRLQVRKTSGGGSSNVNQGGNFSAAPDAPAKVGMVTLGGDDAAYSAKLQVTWSGGTVECEESVGGAKERNL